jgi:CheY-like chemotaxis protein
LGEEVRPHSNRRALVRRGSLVGLLIDRPHLDALCCSIVQPQPLAGISVIVVEDDCDNREVLEIALTAEGASVREAATAEEAWALCTAVPPAIVLTDITLPDQDGVWLLSRIHALAGPRIPVVALTGHAFPHEVAAITAAGFDRYLVKPADLDNLVAVIIELTKSDGADGGGLAGAPKL